MAKKTLFLSTIILILIFSTCEAQRAFQDVVLSGCIKSNVDSCDIVATFWTDFITGERQESGTVKILLDKQGLFNVSLPKIDHPMRMKIEDRATNNVLFDQQQLVEPGDSFYIKGYIHDQDMYTDTNFVASFSGRGVAKYTCIQVLKTIGGREQIFNAAAADKCIQACDSLLKTKLQVLEGFRSSMTAESYDIMKADIVGDINYSGLFSNAICGNQYDGVLSGTLTDEQLREKKRIFDTFSLSRSRIVLSDTAMALSVNYIQYLYSEYKCKLALSSRKGKFEFKDLYYSLRNGFKGLLREKLLAYCILNNVDMAILFGSSDPSVYTKCLKDGTGLIKTPWIKRPVTNYLRSRGKGMSAFNFSLPADSSGRIVKLSDFKGKVILLDMWAYNCTGCYLFNNVFHKMVFPIFKNNPDFAVVSVMADESTKSSYMDRLRGKGGVTMTSSDYTNLFGGKGQVMGRAMEQHYVISGYPAIFLIDKSGKIYSSTLPYFNESDSPNVQKLIEVIKKALTES